LGQGEFGLGTDAMHYFWGEYLGDGSQQTDPRAVPLLADMHSMPPMYIVTAGLDALTDDSRILEQKLRESGIEVVHRHYPGMIHGFFSMALFLDIGDKAVTEAAAALSETLNGPTTAERQ
jgi:acetyl esterase